MILFRLVIGGAGGSRIPSGVVFSVIRHLYMNESLAEAIDARRLHHQLAPMELRYETGFDMNIVNELNQRLGHKIVENKPDGGFAAVVGISNIDGMVEGVIDPRRGGSVEIF
jgi:gamma-glutamyltranspeptidase / glutathione hydrolase / leukotriene-C4 hydrolase